MELWRASIIATIRDFSEGNGFAAIVTCDPSPRTLNSSIIETIATVASKGRPLYSSSKRRVISLFSHPQSSLCQRLPISQREPSRLFALSEVIESLIFSESILNSLRPLSILMSELKSLPVYIKFKFTQGMNWFFPSRINYQHGLHQNPEMGYRCIDTS
jgi:hypothetical protein